MFQKFGMSVVYEILHFIIYEKAYLMPFAQSVMSIWEYVHVTGHIDLTIAMVIIINQNQMQFVE